MAVAIVGKSRDNVLAPLLPRDRSPRNPRLRIPVIGWHVRLPRRLVHGGRKPLLARMRKRKDLLTGGEVGVTQNEDRSAKLFGQVARRDHEMKTFFHGRGGNYDFGSITR